MNAAPLLHTPPLDAAGKMALNFVGDEPGLYHNLASVLQVFY